MKIRTLFVLFSFLLCQWSVAQQTVSSGKLVEYPLFKSANRYDVIYMHDGQMLFDAASTWNKVEWGVDEVLGELLEEKKIRPCIVVGIANIAQSRNEDYFP